MPRADWERDDRLRPQADQPAPDRGLAQRLSRLPGSHPSAWPTPDRADADRADAESPQYGARGAEEWWRHPVGPEAVDTVPEDADDVPEDADDGPEDRADEPDAAQSGYEPDLDGPAGAPGGASGPAAQVRAGRSEVPAGWGEIGRPSARSPYRPWFSSGGAADPWFAVRETD
jgi:hypothetical protein